MATDWFYFKGDQRLGPVGSQQLRDLARAGQLQPDTLIWKEGMPKPQPASRVKGLFEPAITPTPPLPVRAETAAPQESLENGQEEATLPLVLRWVRQCPSFAWGVATGTCYAVKVIVGDQMRHSEARRLKGEIAKQLAALGEKLYESGIGPADLRERIVNKDEAIQQAEGSKASTKAFAKRRQALLIELAQSSLATKTIDSSFQESLQAVSTAQEASEKHEQAFAAFKANRPPVNTLRAVIGAAVICIVLTFAAGKGERDKTTSAGAAAQKPAPAAGGKASARSPAKMSYAVSKGFLKGQMTVELAPEVAEEISLKKIVWDRGHELSFLLTWHTWVRNSYPAYPWRYTVRDKDDTELNGGVIVFPGGGLHVGQTVKTDVLISLDNIDEAVLVKILRNP